ncbi:MAG: serine/threonine protein kinase [Lentisphaeraceae bacterium]|nr:serine/threonine protein kinase [Lentisphaeraceae bacterium]
MSLETKNEFKQLGAYIIEKEIAFGAVGKIYLGKHKTLNIPVAVKVLNREISENLVTSQRFIREAKAAAQMSHINIVKVLDCGTEQDVIYYVMEYVKGGSCGDKLRQEKKPLSENEVLAIGQSVCRALTEAKKFDVVHRDIKPDNIMVSAPGLYKLADLGLAKLQKETNDGQRSDLTGYQIGMGTPHYMAPEQALDAKNVDQRADIYSLGVTMFQLATNQLPYPGADVGAVLRKHAIKEIPDITKINPQLSTEFCKMIYKCMAKTPEKRFQTPKILETHLDKLRSPFLENKPIHQDTVTDITENLYSEINNQKAKSSSQNTSKYQSLTIISILLIIIILAVIVLFTSN